VYRDKNKSIRQAGNLIPDINLVIRDGQKPLIDFNYATSSKTVSRKCQYLTLRILLSRFSLNGNI
jgi:hypothetical protein